MDTVLPDVSPSGLENLYEELVTADCIRNPNSDQPRWRCLPQDPATERSGREGVVFKFLETIAEDITRHCNMTTDERRLKVVGHTPPAGNRQNSSRPDGFIDIGTTASMPVNWADIVMPMEFKNKNDKRSQTDDFVKVLWSMHHTMRNDARRRFVHGFTCENTTARLWYNDRCDVVVSKEFDINKDWKYLVRIILSILVASPVDLGYDSDIELVSLNDGNSEPSYNITIRNPDTNKATVYRTIGIISDIGADSMVGRGTRVWRARKLEDGHLVGPVYALKDVWVYTDRDPEHVIIRKIREKQPDYSQHFLTPIDYGFAPLDPTNPSSFNNTHNPLGRGRDLKPTGKIHLLRVAPNSRQKTTDSRSQKPSVHSRSSVGHSADVEGLPSEGYRDFGRLSKHPRFHYHIAFVEIGEPVHDLRNFTDVFIAIRGGWEGLHAVHLCICVHRDVSSGNILLVPSSDTGLKRGVIMDLEYVKSIDDISAPHDVKMGTAAFMATEVAIMKHHRLSEIRALTVERRRSSDTVDARLEAVRNGNTRLVSLPSPLPPFRHNPLHDMESIWWLCLWTMFYLVPTSEQSDKAQVEGYHKIFSSKVTKKDVLCTPGSLLLHAPHLWKNPTFAGVMEIWAGRLNDHYSKGYEKHDISSLTLQSIRVDGSIVEKSYQTGRKCLQMLQEASETLSDCRVLSGSPRGQETVSIVGVRPTPIPVLGSVFFDVLPRKKLSSNKNDA